MDTTQLLFGYSPDFISSFESLGAVSILGLCFFCLMAIVIPFALRSIMRSHAHYLGMMRDSYERAIDKRDADHRRLVATLEKINEVIDKRLLSIDRKMEKIVTKTPKKTLVRN